MLGGHVQNHGQRTVRLCLKRQLLGGDLVLRLSFAV